jgi:uncharacterized protein YndB with AHSA1/START domain
MKERSVHHHTFVIERNYPATPRRVFAAFADPATKRRWFAEGEASSVEEFQTDFRVGGKERLHFRLVPNQRIVIAYSMTVNGVRISSSQATTELLPAGKGTDLIFTEQAAFFENADGPQIREAGWQQLLEQLGNELASSRE